MDLFRELTYETDLRVERFGKPSKSMLLLGGTGSGKSTTIQYLAGSILEKIEVTTENGGKLEHIAVKTYPLDHDAELKNVSLSPYSVSETRFLRAIKISKIDVTVCDTQCLNDTRGKELDVAN